MSEPVIVEAVVDPNEYDALILKPINDARGEMGTCHQYLSEELPYGSRGRR
jgi:hypothetical protein